MKIALMSQRANASTKAARASASGRTTPTGAGAGARFGSALSAFRCHRAWAAQRASRTASCRTWRRSSRVERCPRSPLCCPQDEQHQQPSRSLPPLAQTTTFVSRRTRSSPGGSRRDEGERGIGCSLPQARPPEKNRTRKALPLIRQPQCPGKRAGGAQPCGASRKGAASPPGISAGFPQLPLLRHGGMASGMRQRRGYLSNIIECFDTLIHSIPTFSTFQINKSPSAQNSFEPPADHFLQIPPL
jgi:hypothetical protein